MEKFREIVPSDIRDCLSFGVVAFVGSSVIIKVTGAVIKWISTKRVENRWKCTPKDVVILHRCPPAYASPSASPFALKLETYLRMTGIQYQVDEFDGFGPKGKTPWITINNVHIADSQICIEYLAKKFEKSIGNYSEEQRAVSTMARIMMDEHFYWGLLMWRYRLCFKYGNTPDKVFRMPMLGLKFFMLTYGRYLYWSCWFQGIGRHSEEQITQIICDDLRALSKLLGDKKFILGDEPCEDDCAIFGEVAQALWCMPGSPYEKLVNEELLNLRQYCVRMKESFWPDWDQCIDQP